MPKKPVQKVINNDDYVTTTDIGYTIGVTPATIRKWLKWWYNPNFPKPNGIQLPDFVYLDRRGTKFFHKDDVWMFKDFKAKIVTTHKGCMSDFNNAYIKGNRGRRTLARQHKDYHEIHSKLVYEGDVFDEQRFNNR